MAEKYRFLYNIPRDWSPMETPKDVAIGPDGKIYVLNTYTGILVFDVSGHYLTTFGSFGMGPGQFRAPSKLAVDAAGNLYVADTGNRRVQKLDQNGNFLWASSPDGRIRPSCVAVTPNGHILFYDRYYHWIILITQTGHFGDILLEEENNIEGMAIDAAGQIYLAIPTLHQIRKYDAYCSNLLTQWGSEGAGDGQFQYPSAITVDQNGHVYVNDPGNNRIQKFDTNGTFLGKWGSYGEAEGQFRDPEGVAVDAAGHVYVADTNNNRIQKFSANGDFITKLGGWPYSPGNLHNPAGVALDGAGNVYVTDQHRLQIFDSEGQFIRGWGEPGSADGEFSFPQGVAVAEQPGAVVVYVADTENHRIQKFNNLGQHLKSWGIEGSAPGQLKNPCGVAFLADSVYVTDSDNHRVQRFTTGGTFSEAWGGRGTLPAQFQWPSGMAVDSTGSIYVVDSGNNYMQKFDAKGNLINTWQGGSPFNYPWGVAAENFVFVTDTNNHRIQKFTQGGIFLTQWGSPGSLNGQLQYPKGIAASPNGRVFVADGNNHRLQVFEPVPSTCQVTCPEVVFPNAPGLCGAVIAYPNPTLSGDCTEVTLSYDPPAGFFQVGSFTIAVIARNNQGEIVDACTFRATVQDVEPPIIICPDDISVQSGAGQGGAYVNFTVHATDNCPGVTVVSNPPSGSFFPLGTTTAICTATDKAGNTTSCSFNITVAIPKVIAQPLITNILNPF